jgi:hypothetical protein
MGSTSDIDSSEMIPEGSVQHLLEEGSFDMTSGDGGGGVMDDFNSGMSMRQVTAQPGY